MAKIRKEEFDIKIDPNGVWHVSPDVREIVNRRFRKEGIDTYLKMTFTGLTKQRSVDQNRYYWGVVIPLVMAGFINSGSDLRIDKESDLLVIHEMLKDKFSTNSMYVVRDRMGQEYSVKVATTTDSDTVEFMRYIRDIKSWTFNHLGIDIPDPNMPMMVVDKHGELIDISVKDFLKTIKHSESL